jgi:autotransporter-associated beta strand protein
MIFLGDNVGYTGEIHILHPGSNMVQLSIGNGGTAGNLDGNNKVFLQRNTALHFNRSDDITFGGVLANTDIGFGASSNGTLGRLYKRGAGTLVLTGNSANFTGATNVVLGTLQIGNASGGADSGFIDSVISLDVATAKVVFDRNTAVTYTKAINGSGAFEKKGDGTLTLSAANGYTGKTTVSGGVLAFSGSGSIATSTEIEITGGELVITDGAQIGSGATISEIQSGRLTLVGASLGQDLDVGGSGAVGGSGTLSGKLNIDGGTLEVAGLLDLNGDVLLDSATLHADLMTSAQLNVNGRFVSNDIVNVTFTPALFDGGNTLTVLGVADSRLDEWTVNGSAIGVNYAWTGDSGNGFSLVAIPEPSTYALLGGVGALALALLRRRRKA